MRRPNATSNKPNAAIGTARSTGSNVPQCQIDCSTAFSVTTPAAGIHPSTFAIFCRNPASTYSIPAFSSTSSNATPAAQNAHIIHPFPAVLLCAFTAMAASKTLLA